MKSQLSFCLFMLFMGFSRQECWSGLPFPSLVDILSEGSTVTYKSWVVIQSVAHSFIELDMAVIYVISLVSFPSLCIAFCLPSDGWRWEACGNRLMGGLVVEKTGSCSGGQGHAQFSSVQFSSVPQSCLSL